MSLSDIFGKKVKSLNDVQTVGDLKKLIKYAQSAKRAEAGKEAAEEWAKASLWDETFGKIPGLSTAKNATDMLKAMYDQPDEARTGTALDHLDVDDDVAKIVDDPIENAFLKQYVEDLEGEDDNRPLSDVNVTKELSKFIKSKFNDRTVIGFNEGKEKMRMNETSLRRMIRRLILENSAGPNPYTDVKYQYGSSENGGTFVITEEDMQYWADKLGIDSSHPMNPSAETGRYAPKYNSEGTLMLYADPYEYNLTIMHGDMASGWVKINGHIDEFKNKWFCKIYVDGGYGSYTIDVANPADIRDPANKAVFADLFKNWDRYAKGQSRGSFEYAGTWD